MNKKILAISVGLAILSSQVFSLELYNENGNTFSLGGHVSIGVIDNGNQVELYSNSPRVNFNATSQLTNDFILDVKGEWALNMLNGGENSFATRLGYIGLTHDDYGRVVVGTQSSPYYDVAGVADQLIEFGNDFLYDNQYNLGTARSEKMISYRNNLSFGKFGDFKFGFGLQGKNDSNVDVRYDIRSLIATNDSFARQSTNYEKYDTRIQAALAYTLQGVTLGYATNTGDITKISSSFKYTATAVSNVFALSYGTYGNGLYIAGMFAANESMNLGKNNQLLVKSNAYELLAAYNILPQLNISLSYEVVEGKELNQATTTVKEHAGLIGEYKLAPNLAVYAGYQLAIADQEENKWALGVRYWR